MAAQPRPNELIEYIAREFGHDVAIKVWQEFQGEQPYIPKFPAREDPIQLHIMQGLQEGKPNRVIAKELNLTVRSIQSRLNKPLNVQQTCLFSA